MPSKCLSNKKREDDGIFTIDLEKVRQKLCLYLNIESVFS